MKVNHHSDEGSIEIPMKGQLSSKPRSKILEPYAFCNRDLDEGSTVILSPLSLYFPLSLAQRWSQKKMRGKQLTQRSGKRINFLVLETETLPALFKRRQRKAPLLQAGF